MISAVATNIDATDHQIRNFAIKKFARDAQVSAICRGSCDRKSRGPFDLNTLATERRPPGEGVAHSRLVRIGSGDENAVAVGGDEGLHDGAESGGVDAVVVGD